MTATLPTRPAHSRPPEPDRTACLIGDTPHSAYLRAWLRSRASRHRDLLRTVAAASRRGVA